MDSSEPGGDFTGPRARLSHRRSETCLFLTDPTPCKLTAHPRCWPLLQACYLNRGLEAGTNPEPPHFCHLGSPGLEVCSYSERMVFRGPSWQLSASPKSFTLTSPTCNPLMVSFVLRFRGSNSLQIQDLSHVSGTPAAWGQSRGIPGGRRSGDHRRVPVPPGDAEGRPGMTGAPQDAPVQRTVSEFCPLPWPAEASRRRRSCASAAPVGPSHHSLGPEKGKKEGVGGRNAAASRQAPGEHLTCSPVQGAGHPGAASFLDSESPRPQETRPGH